MNMSMQASTIIEISIDVVYIALRTDGYDISTLAPMEQCQHEVEMGGEYNKLYPVIEIVPVVTVLVEGTGLVGVYRLDTREDVLGGHDDRHV